MLIGSLYLLNLSVISSPRLFDRTAVIAGIRPPWHRLKNNNDYHQPCMVSCIVTNPFCVWIVGSSQSSGKPVVATQNIVEGYARNQTIAERLRKKAELARQQAPNSGAMPSPRAFGLKKWPSGGGSRRASGPVQNEQKLSAGTRDGCAMHCLIMCLCPECTLQELVQIVPGY